MMDDQFNSNLSEEDLIQKHRKERKELQAKIQSIKKTSDKKKKKESMQIIAQLELELKEQQEKELEHLKNNFVQKENTIEEQNCEFNEKEQKLTERLSKAQRRRNKKSEQEKENQRKIAEQDIENEIGARNVEMQSINNILNKMGLSLHSVPSNGDCLYQAICHQLDVTNRDLLTVNELRKNTADYLIAHKDDVLPFMLNDNGSLMTDDHFKEYCYALANTKSWGGHVELTALSNLLKCPIHVLQAVGPTTILGEQFSAPPLILTYHRHMYGLGEHYNSTIEKSVVNINHN